VLQVLIEWDGRYDRTDAQGTVDPGVATWEEFKDQAEEIALFGLERRSVGPGTRSVAGEPGTSHEFDISNGEAYALRTLSAGALRLADVQRTHETLAARFRDSNADTWREPRRMYEVMAQGAAAPPELPSSIAARGSSRFPSDRDWRGLAPPDPLRVACPTSAVTVSSWGAPRMVGGGSGARPLKRSQPE